MAFGIVKFFPAMSRRRAPRPVLSVMVDRPEQAGTSPNSPASADRLQQGRPAPPRGAIRWVRLGSRILMMGGLALLAYGLGWNFSTRTYLKGFADAVVPLTGSPEEKTKALLGWFHDEPARQDKKSTGLLNDRDPVRIVQNIHLLKICGTASNAFMNLADEAGLEVRRLLLLGPSGKTKHVVVEVKFGGQWIVVNPWQGLVFKDRLGRGLTRQELRNPEVYQDAISRMPGYDPSYTFEHTVHVRLERLPLVGIRLRKVLNRLAPGWEEWVNWSYFSENPPLWLVAFSIFLLLLGLLGDLMARRRGRPTQGIKPHENGSR